MLERVGVAIEVLPANIDETPRDREDPEAYVAPNTSLARGTQTMRQIRVPKTVANGQARRTQSTKASASMRRSTRSVR